MKRPNSKRNLDMAIIRLAGSNENFPRTRSIIANAIVGQMLPGGVVKGGSSLKIRYGDASTRATTDLDAARARDIDAFVGELEAALEAGWNGFTGQLVVRKPATPKRVPAQYVMQPFQVKLSYLGRAWCSVELEVGHNEIGDADAPELVEPAEANALLAQMGFPPLGPIALMPLHFQVAQKLHGASEPGSKRAHDLIDLQVIMMNSDVDLPRTRQTCERLFAYRQMQAWPPVIVKGEGWDTLYESQLLGEPVKQTVDEAVKWANALIARIASSR
jgi:hypothetical protein